jgi:hypothetical protein
MLNQRKGGLRTINAFSVLMVSLVAYFEFKLYSHLLKKYHTLFYTTGYFLLTNLFIFR